MSTRGNGCDHHLARARQTRSVRLACGNGCSLRDEKRHARCREVSCAAPGNGTRQARLSHNTLFKRHHALRRPAFWTAYPAGRYVQREEDVIRAHLELPAAQ